MAGSEIAYLKSDTNFLLGPAQDFPEFTELLKMLLLADFYFILIVACEILKYKIATFRITGNDISTI